MSKLTTADKVEILKRLDIFREFTDYVLKSIADVMDELELKQGENIITKGDEGNCMFVIYDGIARIHDDDVKIAEVSGVNILGEMALLTSEPRNATVTALSDCKLLMLNRQAFEVISEDNLDFYKSVTKVLIKKLQKQNAELIEFSKNARRIFSMF